MASNDGGQAKPYRVLALDGGGIRGYYTTRLLELLLASIGADPVRVDFGRLFDLIVGTSTGSLIGAALAAGVPLPRVSALYRERGPVIFPRPAPIGRWNLLWCAAHWRRASADATALRDALERLLGGMTLAELYAQRGVALCVTVTDLGAARSRVFATPHGAADRDCADLRLVDVCMASSAAPMLLPPIRLPRRGGDDTLCCDGGLWATSPVGTAIGEALAVAAVERPVEILSIGTCAMRVPSAALARLVRNRHRLVDSRAARTAGGRRRTGDRGGRLRPPARTAPAAPGAPRPAAGSGSHRLRGDDCPAGQCAPGRVRSDGGARAARCIAQSGRCGRGGL